MSQPFDSSTGQHKPPQRWSSGKCKLIAVIVMISPMFAWPLMALFVVGGCAGSLHTGISCPPILGIHFHAVPTDLLQLSAKGLAFSVPLGLALLAVCRLVLARHKS